MPEREPDDKTQQDVSAAARSWAFVRRIAPRLLREGSLYFGLLAIFVVGALASDTFLQASNQRDVLRAVSQNGILAVGMTLVIITAGIDLSVGRMLGLGSTLAAMLLIDRRWTAATWLTLPAAAVAAGILAALLAKALFVGNRRDRPGFLVGAVGFVLGAALVGAWTVPQVGRGMSILAVLVVVPLCGFILGGLSGVIIAKCRLQPFIVTLAMMTSAYGAARLIASGGGKTGYIHSLYDSQGNVPAGVDWLRKFDAAKIADAISSWAPAGVTDSLRGGTLEKIFDLIPVPGVFFLVCLAIGMFILNRLRFGRHIYAIGGNEETARLSGINVDRVKIAVYAISGMLACLAGVLACAQYRQGKPDMGTMAELEAIAAVVIGGTSLMGGRGRMAGTLVGVLIFGYLTNILSLRGLSTDVQLFVTGIIIVVAVLLQEGFVQRLPRLWRVRAMLLLFFALGALLYILRADVGLIYWRVLAGLSVAILAARLVREWNWVDPAAICLLAAFLGSPYRTAGAVSAAGAAAVVGVVLWVWSRRPRAVPPSPGGENGS